MMGIQATYIDDSRLCCSSIRQGEISFLMICSGCFLTFNWGKGWRRGVFPFQTRYAPWLDWTMTSAFLMWELIQFV
ncbi:unnamed protein product [Sphenostylis stenocarpa]|uniref:Uncharacterized protein n=1 Tax=Sphenostylis stenocarpa TaxID=92480 RepID=A0AA86VKX0_9FABA|nr:unnamed protein product [Sphenostylis stenocarpa]